MKTTNNNGFISTMDFIAKNGSTEGLSKAEELNLITAAQNGNKAAENKLVKHFTFYVMSITKNFFAKKLDPEDLVLAGQTGFLKAVRKYDLKSGTRLSTYARAWIEKEIYDELYNNDSTIRIPQNVLAEMRSYEKALDKAPEYLCEAERNSYAASVSGLSQKRIDNLKTAAVCNGSLDSFLGQDEDNDSRVSLVSDARIKTPEEEYLEKEVSEAVASFKSRFLTDQEVVVADARSGFGYEVPLSLSETAEVLGVSKSAVRDIEKRIAKKARNEEARQLFDGFKSA